MYHLVNYIYICEPINNNMPQKFIKTLLFWVLATSAIAQVDPVGKNNVAIGGYDVVSYFQSLTPKIGQQTIQAEYKGVYYYFSSDANKKTFLKNPSAYLPQYDGYCAYAIGKQGKKVTIDPLTFKITNGRLFLFYNGSTGFSGTQFNSLEPWIADEAALIIKSDANWKKINNKE